LYTYDDLSIAGIMKAAQRILEENSAMTRVFVFSSVWIFHTMATDRRQMAASVTKLEVRLYMWIG
jgi:hypothetical protein